MLRERDRERERERERKQGRADTGLDLMALGS